MLLSLSCFSQMMRGNFHLESYVLTVIDLWNKMFCKRLKKKQGHIIFEEHKRHTHLMLNVVMLQVLFLTGNKNSL